LNVSLLKALVTKYIINSCNYLQAMKFTITSSSSSWYSWLWSCCDRLPRKDIGPG